METLSEFLKSDKNQIVVLSKLVDLFRTRGDWGKRGLFVSVASETGFTQAYVGQMLTGKKKITDVFVEKLADYFGVPVVYLRGEKEALEIQLSSDDVSLLKSFMAVSGYTEITDKSVSEFASKLIDMALEEESLKKIKLQEEFAYNSKIIDHLYSTGGALVDSRMVENQKEVLDDLIMRQGKIVDELKEMGIDILSDPEQQDKKI